MATLQEYFLDYASAHRTRGNRVCHWFGIPLITISLLGLLSRVPFFEAPMGVHVDAAWLLLGFAALRFVVLDPKLALAFTIFATGLYFLSLPIPASALWVALVVGIVFQGVGHSKYERNRPALLRNLNHILIGPLYLFAVAIRYGSRSTATRPE